MDPESKVGKFDQLVRPGVTIMLVVAFIWGFIVKLIDTPTFVPVVILVIGFWFGSRSQQTTGASTTKTTETDPSGAKREVTMTATPGAPAPTPPDTAKGGPTP